MDWEEKCKKLLQEKRQFIAKIKEYSRLRKDDEDAVQEWTEYMKAADHQLEIANKRIARLDQELGGARATIADLKAQMYPPQHSDKELENKSPRELKVELANTRQRIVAIQTELAKHREDNDNEDQDTLDPNVNSIPAKRKSSFDDFNTDETYVPGLPIPRIPSSPVKIKKEPVDGPFDEELEDSGVTCDQESLRIELPFLDYMPSSQTAAYRNNNKNEIQNELDQDLLTGSTGKTTFVKLEDPDADENQTPRKKPKTAPKTLDKWFNKKPKLHQIADDNEFVKLLINKDDWHPNDFKPSKVAYHQVVRGKKRQKLPGRPCKECLEYYKARGRDSNCTHRQVLKDIDKNSRHRNDFGTESPPKNFWDPDMAPTQEEQEEWARHRRSKSLRRLYEDIEHSRYVLRDEKLQNRLEEVNWDFVEPHLIDMLYEEI